jgi:hypothetical protein
MGFMDLEIERGLWLTIETKNHGSTLIPADIVNLSFREPDNTPIDELTDESSLSAVADYCEGEPVSVTIHRGAVAWRLSASGYMDQTGWTLADRPDEDRAFREACDAHDDICIECGATDSTHDRDDNIGSQFCRDCVALNASIVDTAQSTSGDHTIDDGRAWLVSFGDLGDVVVSARYTEADEDSALDIACALMIEESPDWFLNIEEHESVADDDVQGPGLLTHDEMMERARGMADAPKRLATRYAAGA